MRTLPDDRDTHLAVCEVMTFLTAHERERVEGVRIARATALSEDRVAPVLEALHRALVIDCDGDVGHPAYTYTPDSILDLEVRRFLRMGAVPERGLQRGVDRYRDRYSR
jgi:hypothetical protein